MEPVANTLYAANHMSHFTGEDQNPKEAQKSVLEKGIGMKIIDDDPPQKSFCGWEGHHTEKKTGKQRNKGNIPPGAHWGNILTAAP